MNVLLLLMCLEVGIVLFLSLTLIICALKIIIIIFKEEYKEHKKFKKIYSKLNYYKFYKTAYLFSDDDKNDNCIYFDLEFEDVRLAKNEFIISHWDNYSIMNNYWNLRFKKWFKKNIDFKNIPLHSYDSN
jgi:hypothetical protein